MVSLSFLSLVVAMALINAKSNFHVGLMMERLHEVRTSRRAAAAAAAAAAGRA